MLPRLVIDLEKLRHNACTLCAMTRERGISALAFVTKVFCADREMVRVLAQTPCRYLADSRIENLARCEGLGKERILLRLPMPSQAESVVRNAEISFNSELATLRALSTAAGKLGLVHKVVLMIDLGDLREGIFCENADAILQTAREIEHDCNLELYGAAFNVTCYGSVLPTTENLGVFLSLTRQIEAVIGRRLALVSGGNSSSIPPLLSGNMQPDINNLRLGEALVLGRETAHGTARTVSGRRYIGGGGRGGADEALLSGGDNRFERIWRESLLLRYRRAPPGHRSHRTAGYELRRPEAPHAGYHGRGRQLRPSDSGCDAERRAGGGRQCAALQHGLRHAAAGLHQSICGADIHLSVP